MDQLSPTEFASVVTAITSAFGDPTRTGIYLFAHSIPAGVTASEVAGQFDLHANVARHHLDKLSAGGYLEISTERPPNGSSGAGRPSKRYRACDEEMTLNVSVRQDDVLVKLLGRALGELGTERATALAEEVGVEFGEEMAGAMGEQNTRSFRAALHSVADALSAHGFAAHAEKEGNSLRLVTEHCPFGDTAVEHPVICAVDRGMVKGMLGALYGETRVDLTSASAGSRDNCITAFDNDL